MTLYSPQTPDRSSLASNDAMIAARVRYVVTSTTDTMARNCEKLHSLVTESFGNDADRKAALGNDLPVLDAFCDKLIEAIEIAHAPSAVRLKNRRRAPTPPASATPASPRNE